jgi:hypothetical protein
MRASSVVCLLLVGIVAMTMMVNATPISYAGYKVLRLTVQPNQLEVFICIACHYYHPSTIHIFVVYFQF